MAKVEIANAASRDLERLVESHSLPASTKARVARSLEMLADFPLAGAQLTGRWRDMRFVLGPWRWMIIVYRYLPEADRVIVATIQDGRSAASPTNP